MNNTVESVFSVIKDYCTAIYLSGSRVDPVINYPQDFDYVCFSKPLQKLNLSTCQCINKVRVVRDGWKINDFSSIREYPYTQITWFSYLDVLMQKEVGADLCPKTDIIVEHRDEFIACLREKADELLSNKIKKQKRWYHILRGVYILLNNSYEVTPEQKADINTLHDLSYGWEKVRDKTIKLLDALN